MNARTKFILFMIGEVLACSVSGNLNNSGMLIPYFTSYFYYMDKSIKSSDLMMISPISFLTEAVMTVVIIQLVGKFLIYDLVVFGVFVSCSLLFVSSFVLSPVLFCVVYGVGLGYLSAALFLPILIILWEHVDEDKPRNTGIVLGGYYFGIIPFGILFTMVVNPYNYASDQVSSEGEEPQSIYPSSVSDRVPSSIRIMTLGFLITSISGLLLIPRKLIPKKKEKNSMTFDDLFQNKIFWSLFFTLFTAFAAIGYIQFVYKILGNLYINDDHFLSLSGSAAFAVGGVGRVVYGFLLNKFNWRLVMIFTYAFYTLLAFSFWCSIHSKSLFLAYLLGLWWCSASFYNGIALQTNKAFPGNEWVLSYVGLAYTPAYAMPFVLEEWVTPAIGYFWTCILVAFLPTCALVITALHPEPKPRIIISSLEELNS